MINHVLVFQTHQFDVQLIADSEDVGPAEVMPQSGKNSRVLRKWDPPRFVSWLICYKRAPVRPHTMEHRLIAVWAPEMLTSEKEKSFLWDPYDIR